MKQLFAILLAVFILTSSIGIKVNRHFCKKEGVITSYILDVDECSCDAPQKDHSCCHKSAKKPCHKEENNENDGCCHHESDFFILDTDYTEDINEINIPADYHLIAAIYYTLFPSEISLNDDPYTIDYHAYKPPLPDRDIPVLIQSFLI